ncbi:MAG: carbonic anhydrase [Candidatus Woesearchaeota archaeon]
MPKSIIKEILENNEQYHDKVQWDLIKQGQSPKITLVTCSDSRVSGHIFGKDLVNFVFHVRNIGNQIVNNFGSVDYGIHHLKTPILMILGHTDCGAIKASQKDFSSETTEIKKELYPLYFNLRIGVKEAKSEADKITKLVQLNVDVQVNEALKRYGTEHTFIVGAIFDIHNHYGSKEGKVIITNINGITDEQKLKEHPLLSALTKEMLNARVKRL